MFQESSIHFVTSSLSYVFYFSFKSLEIYIKSFVLGNLQLRNW